jgi:hypothetical protein
VTSAPQPEQSSLSVIKPEDVSNNKRKRGQRGCNKMSFDVVYVTKLDSNGPQSEPPEAKKAFKCASRFQVRDNIPITITDWWQVPMATKDKFWSNMKENIKFAAGAEDIVKNAMFINMGSLFRKWKSELNMKYMKKGLVPKYMGKITKAQWKKFVQQKTNPKALVISNEYAEMSKKNIYPHHMRLKENVAKIFE